MLLLWTVTSLIGIKTTFGFSDVNVRDINGNNINFNTETNRLLYMLDFDVHLSVI